MQPEFELMVISPEGEYPGETKWVNKLFAEGLETFHLRKPGWSAERLKAYLQKINSAYHSRIMLHYREELLKSFELKGIHFQCDYLPMRKTIYNLSCGAHSWEEFNEVSEVVDYAFVSPFFNSISKQGYQANPELKEIPSGVNRKKVVALGGIDSGNIHFAQEQNLKGAAVLGAVWQAENPLEAYLQLASKIAEWQSKDP